MKTTFIGKEIRIDIYAKDSDGNVYDIEMQTTEETDLHLRTRYYHSEMDGYQIRAGQKYFNLKQSVVIFPAHISDPFSFLSSYNSPSTWNISPCKFAFGKWADAAYQVFIENLIHLSLSSLISSTSF